MVAFEEVGSGATELVELHKVKELNSYLTEVRLAWTGFCRCSSIHSRCGNTARWTISSEEAVHNILGLCTHHLLPRFEIFYRRINQHSM